MLAFMVALSSPSVSPQANLRHTRQCSLRLQHPGFAPQLTRRLEVQHRLERLQHRPAERPAEVRRELLGEARVSCGPARGPQVQARHLHSNRVGWADHNASGEKCSCIDGHAIPLCGADWPCCMVPRCRAHLQAPTFAAEPRTQHDPTGRHPGTPPAAPRLVQACPAGALRLALAWKMARMQAMAAAW